MGVESGGRDTYWDRMAGAVPIWLFQEVARFAVEGTIDLANANFKSQPYENELVASIRFITP